MRTTGIADRIAFVTGAGGGIGAAVVRLLLEEGAQVVGADSNPQALQSLPAHDRLRTEVLDVSDAQAVDSLIDTIEQTQGPIDLGVNVAGILATDTVADTTPERWREVFEVNTHGVFHVCKALARHMTPRQRGAMVTVGSNAAGIPRHSMAAYAASKAAATMFTRCLGLELAPAGIRCNIVAPGSTLTPMQTGMWADEHGAQHVIAGSLATFKTGIPLGRIATPEDIANAVVFLLSEQARHITMTDLYVDGGATLRA